MNGTVATGGRRPLIPHAARKRRAARHLLVALPVAGIVYAMLAVGTAWRDAAECHDASVRAWRQAVRVALHAHDAVSIIEHAATGLGAALFGAALLQIVYAWRQWPGAPEDGPAAAFDQSGAAAPRSQQLAAIAVAAIAATLAALVAFSGTGLAITALALLAISVPFLAPAALAAVATDAPGRFIMLAATLPWAVAELGWKLHHVAITHEPLATVAAQLGAGLAMLLATSFAAGALTRRYRWLHPADHVAPAGESARATHSARWRQS